MTFTALHRALGTPPGPLTDMLLDDAVAAGVVETDDLDWKSKLPPRRGLPQTDFPKDVAAMANSGGGVIVYGVAESQKAALERVDAGELDENHERALRSAAFTAISPPVFGLNIHRLPGGDGKRAVVVEVPPSVDVPHLVYKDDYFGAPLRNDADTVWMKERQVEAMYRARFEERRHASEELDTLFEEASAGHDVTRRAWLVAVARPRIPQVHSRLSRDDARTVLRNAAPLSLGYAGRDGFHPLEVVDRNNPRPGLRRWVAASGETGWKEAWITIHHNGSVTLAAAAGGRKMATDTFLGGGEIDSSDIECAAADLMALVRATANETGNDEYDVRIGIGWVGGGDLKMLAKDRHGLADDSDTPVPRFTPVDTTVNAAAADPDFQQRVYDLALDCVNQGGIPEPRLVCPPEKLP